MRITSVEVRPLSLSLIEPYQIAYETVDSVDNILLRVETDAGPVGLGIAAPDEAVTGESVASAIRALTDVAEPLLHGADPLRRGPLTEALVDAAPHNPCVRAAVDMVLYDLMGKAAGMPVWRMLGGYRDRIETSITLYITTHDETVRRAVAFAEQGFRALKLKGGLDVEADIARVLSVREAVGPDIGLRYDANQGYDVPAAVRFYEATRGCHLQMIEQPTPAGNLDQLRRVTRAVELPVMADEAVVSLAQAFLFARGDAMDMVNLKLVKVGGLDAAMLINAVARAAGLEVMVGCMDEAALSIASGLAFALSRRNVEFADLDGHMDLVGDPTASSVILRDGVLFPSDLPGFGIVDV